MTLTAMTEAPEAPAAGLAGLAGPVSGRQAERLQAQLVAAQVKRQDRAAEDERRRQDQAAADKRRQENLAAEDERRARRKKERDEQRADRRRERAEALAGAGEWMSEHRDVFAFAPIVFVPALLSWSAMSNFGIALFGTNGHTLPVLSEVGMWIFEAKITGARRKGERVWNYYAGMVFCAGVCAALNFMHGDLGPIPGSIKPSVLTGIAYALIAVSGIIIHQLATVGRHAKQAAAPGTSPEGNAAPGAEGATNAPAAVQLTGPLGRPLLPIVALGGPATEGAANPPAPGAGGPLGGQDDGRATAAERDRLARENAALRRQLADAARDSGNEDGDRDDDTEMPARRGAVRAGMRAHWEKEIAAGNIPNGAELNREAGKPANYSLGKRYASEWRNELPAEFIEQVTGNQQEAGTQEEPAGAALAGVAR